MGDVVSLVEKAQKDFDEKEMENLQSQMMSGRFSMNDLLKQFIQMKKMGGMTGMMSYMPGVSKIKNMIENNDFDEKIIDHQIAIIRSMTKNERAERAPPHLVECHQIIFRWRSFRRAIVEQAWSRRSSSRYRSS